MSQESANACLPGTSPINASAACGGTITVEVTAQCIRTRSGNHAVLRRSAWSMPVVDVAAADVGYR